MAGDVDLFGNEVETPEDGGPSGSQPSNDMRLVQEVLQTAVRSGFMLTGSARRVCRTVSSHEIELASQAVAAMVEQLIETRWLHVGGTHQVRWRGQMGPARSVLVPQKSRQRLAKWRALQPLSTWKGVA